MENNEKLVWHTEQRKISDLVPFEQNPRKMTEEQIRQLSESLNRFNLVEIPAIDTDNKIVAGHQRLKVMSILGRGEEIIDVRVPNRKLTESEFKEYLVRSNKNTGDWDFDMLANVFDNTNLMEWGFTPGELGLATGDGKDQIDVDNMAKGLEGYMNSEIKQIVLYFKGTDYEGIVKRVDEVMAKTDAKDYSELFLQMLAHYENYTAQK